MNILPVHARDPDRGFGGLFHNLAQSDRVGEHHIVDDVAAADIILFLDLNELGDDVSLRSVRRHPLVTAYPDRSFVYCESDQPWCALPGLYVSMPARSFQRRRQAACGYIAGSLNDRLAATNADAVVPDLLFSFVGRGGNMARDAVLRLVHPRGLIRDMSFANFFGGNCFDVEDRKRVYAATMYRSMFILCPRGAGTSSYRLFEAMQVGRVPVIISDQWVPPAGPVWERFAVFCREDQIDALPGMLERLAPRAPEMGRIARGEWIAWYSPEVRFHRMVETCGMILADRRVPERWSRFRPSLRHWRLRARHAKAALKKTVIG